MKAQKKKKEKKASTERGEGKKKKKKGGGGFFYFRVYRRIRLNLLTLRAFSFGEAAKKKERPDVKGEKEGKRGREGRKDTDFFLN